MPTYYLQYGFTNTALRDYANGQPLTLEPREFLDDMIHGKKRPNEVLKEVDANSWLAARAQV